MTARAHGCWTASLTRPAQGLWPRDGGGPAGGQGSAFFNQTKGGHRHLNTPRSQYRQTAIVTAGVQWSESRISFWRNGVGKTPDAGS